MAKSLNILNVLIENPFLLYALGLALILLTTAVYVFLTPFEKVVSIKDKSEYASGKYLFNTVSDETGAVYVISNSWPILHFTSAEVLHKMEVEKTYRVRGNGLRVPILGLYPNIVSAVEL